MNNHSAAVLTIIVLLSGFVFWILPQPGSALAAADSAQGQVPEIDRDIPKTETALFALG